MPIREYLDAEAGFTPEGVAVLNRAFSDALAAVGIKDDDKVARERLAKIIIRVAGEHRTIDVDGLFVRAVKDYRAER